MGLQYHLLAGDLRVDVSVPVCPYRVLFGHHVGKIKVGERPDGRQMHEHRARSGCVDNFFVPRTLIRQAVSESAIFETTAAVWKTASAAAASVIKARRC